MSISIKDQLLRAGLVTEERIKKAEEKPQRKPQPKKKPAQPHKRRPVAAKPKAAPAPVEPVLSAEERAAAKALKQKLREFLREHRLNKNQVDDEVKQALGKTDAPAEADNGESPPPPAAPTGPVADIKYYFQLQGRAHHLYLTAEQRQGVIAGELSILVRNERYYLLTAADLATAREMAPESVVFTATDSDSETTDADDPYAAFRIPDDLHW
ncbi:MAG: DUF2058 domain-containing protein [Gammaproteobacteria bacterium]|nr:DUF2058 domain-containing protein [Gammaproteobacteria bacterium]